MNGEITVSHKSREIQAQPAKPFSIYLQSPDSQRFQEGNHLPDDMLLDELRKRQAFKLCYRGKNLQWSLGTFTFGEKDRNPSLAENKIVKLYFTMRHSETKLGCKKGCFRHWALFLMTYWIGR